MRFCRFCRSVAKHEFDIIFEKFWTLTETPNAQNFQIFFGWLLGRKTCSCGFFESWIRI